jgi:uncharacterized protein YhaN
MGKLNFKSIAVRKAPGFRNGLDVPGFGELSEGINIIAGPNGAGKSTTARIIQQLIWHNRTQGLIIDGTFKLDGSSWSIEIDSSFIRIQKDGIDSQPAGIPSAEMQKTYMLALHELINVGDEDLAKRIQDESVGGFDLESAQNALDYSDEKKRSRPAELTNFKNARDRLKEITKDHRELKKTEETLILLKREREESERAEKLKTFYIKAEEFLKAEQDLANKKNILDTYSPALKEATGDEFSTLSDLYEEIASEQERNLKARQTSENYESEIDDLPVPEGGIDDETLNALRERIAILAEVEKDIRVNEPEIRKQEEIEQLAKTRIDNLSDPDQWKGINLSRAGDLDRYFHNAFKLTEKEQSLKSEIEGLEKEPSGDKKNAEILKNGIRLLSEWLRGKRGKSGMPVWIIAIISLAGILSVIAVHFLGRYDLIGIPVIVILFVTGILLSRNRKTRLALSLRQSDFTNTGLKGPQSWDEVSVSERLQELQAELDEVLVADSEEKDRLAKLEFKRQALSGLAASIDEMNKTRKQLLDELKAIPDLPKNSEDNFSTLYLFLVHLKEWQTAYSELTAAREAQKKREEQRDSELTKCNLIFTGLNAGSAEDSISVKKIYDKLYESENKRREYLRNILSQQTVISDSQKRLESAVSKVEAVYKKLGIENGKIEEVRKLMEQFPRYKSADQDHHTAGINFTAREAELKSHPLYNENSAEIDGLQADDIRSRITECEIKASNLSDLIKRITEIEVLVKQKKEGGELEQAIADRKNALAQIEDLYDRNLSSRTGFLLLEHLKKETGEQSRPEVFKKATRILNRITSGRYELRVSGKNKAEFKAYDTVLKQGLDLAEISTGTRVQLLMAIRLAFIESQESSIKIPILADELLANSDDQRGSAIIEALYEISRDGRQIFYFTSQPYEAGKWASFLKNKNDPHYKIIMLDGTGKGKRKPEKPELGRIEFVREIPAPGKTTIEKYGKMLNIPEYDLISGISEQVSVYYLTDDPVLLYNCYKSGIQTWGQLMSYYNNNGKMERLSEEAIKKMRIRIRLLEEFQELYRQGRPRPVDMDILEESGIVTDPFREQIKQSLDDVKGNPIDLLESFLKIPKFRKEKIEKLKDYFFDKEYLDESKPLDKNEIILHLQAKISRLEIDSGEAESFINKILGAAMKGD